MEMSVKIFIRLVESSLGFFDIVPNGKKQWNYLRLKPLGYFFFRMIYFTRMNFVLQNNALNIARAAEKFLDNKLSEDFSSLAELLLPFFKIQPLKIYNSREAKEEKLQMIGEFLVQYREKRASFILFGQFTKEQIFQDIIRHLRNFALSCLSPYRKKITITINSVVRPANGFKKVRGKIVGRISDIDNNLPSPLSEFELLKGWEKIKRPNLKTSTGLPKQKDLANIVNEMFEFANGWVFKANFIKGIEMVCGLNETVFIPFQHNYDPELGILGLEGLSQTDPFKSNNQVYCATEFKLAQERQKKHAEKFISELSQKWQLIVFKMLMLGESAAKVSKQAGISQQGCGKAYRTIIKRLKLILLPMELLEKKAFVYWLDTILYAHFEVDKKGGKK